MHIEMEHYCPELIGLYFKLAEDIVEHQAVKVDEKVAFSVLNTYKLPHIRV
jgi:hypothetical protein